MGTLKSAFAVFLLACLLITKSNAAWFGGPSNYDECILENMRGITSNVAAQSILQACKRKFPQNTSSPEYFDLPKEAIDKIEGNANKAEDGNIKGNIFNGSEDWHITELTVRIKDKLTQAQRDYITTVRLWDSITTDLRPLSKGEFSFTPYEFPKDWDWYIVGGRGYQKK